MKCKIQVLNFSKIKKERNPGIKRALENAPLYSVILRIYIDGDPEYKRKVFLN